MNMHTISIGRWILFLFSILVLLTSCSLLAVAQVPPALEPGDRGSSVTQLQTILQTLGYFTYPAVTDFYGPQTELAVQRFQASLSIVDRGTPATTGYGRFGPLTRAALTQYIDTVSDPIATSSSVTIAMQIPAINLALQSTGPAVRTLQQILNQLGYPVATDGPGSTGNETMYFGPATQAALIAFQKARGIEPAVGFFGPVTQVAMRGVYSQQQSSTRNSQINPNDTTTTTITPEDSPLPSRTIRGGGRSGGTGASSPSQVPPVAVSDLVASTPDVPGAIAIDFTLPAAATTVEYRWREVGDTDWSAARTLSSDYIARDNLPSDTEIEIQVRSQNAAGTSDWSNIATASSLKYALVWFIGGQSNADGYAPISQDPEKSEVANAVETLTLQQRAQQPGLRITNQTTGAFQQPHIAIGNTSGRTWTSGLYGIPNPTFSFGPEIGIINATLDNSLPTLGGAVPTYIIKSTLGGTELDYWRPGQAGYSQFQTVLRTGLNNLVTNGYTIFPQGFLWVQGERDANLGYTDNYAERLNVFTEYYREQLGAPELPIAIGEIIALGSAMNAIRAEQASYVASDEYAFLINNYLARDSVGDSIHIDAAGQIAMGSDWVRGTQEFSSRGDGILEHIRYSTLRPAFEVPEVVQSNGETLALPIRVSEDATLYWSVLSRDAAAPNRTEIQMGTASIAHGSTTHLQNTLATTTILGLTVDTDYDIYLVAETEEGVTSTIKVLPVTTRVVPTAPANLILSAVSTSSLVVSFDLVPSATSYAVRYQTDPDGVWQVVSNFTSGNSLVNLEVGTTYNVAVRAENNDIVSAWSATTSTSTLNTIFTDTFTRADEDLSDNPNWTQLTGAVEGFAVRNNQVAVIAQQNTLAVVPDRGAANHFVEATWKTTINRPTLYLTARSANVLNFVGVRRNNDVFELAQVVANVITVIGTTTAALNDQVRLEVVDETARLLKNDVEVVPWSAIDASLTSTRAGLINKNSPLLDPWVDDFVHGVIE